MIFGVFDIIHPGHKHLIEQARYYGEHLVIVVARDRAVQLLKHKTPAWHELKRKDMLQEMYPEATVVLGDEQQGSYGVIAKHRPDMICLGYDQDTLGKDLKEKMTSRILPSIEIRTLKPHEPWQYKTSKLM